MNVAKSYWQSLMLKEEQTTTTAKPEPSYTVKGSPEVISKYIYEDIQKVKQDIRKFNELTKVFQKTPLYYKLFKLLEKSQFDELENVKRKFDNDFNHEYYKQLNQLYKQFLREYDDFSQMLTNNYNHGIQTSDMNKRNQKNNPTIISPFSSSSASTLNSSTKEDNPRHLICLNIENLEEFEYNIPDHLLDPISFELFNDPVITPSGITYEKSHILDHLDRKGHVDPLSRTPLNPNSLYPNLAIKDSTLEYISQHNHSSSK